MKSLILKCVIISAVLLMSGCKTTEQMYTWGQYEDLIYEFHNTESTVEPQQQIELLQKTIASAQVTNKKVAPGLYAHLGMLYSSVGESDNAKAALKQESELYPEAKTFINGMLTRSQSAK